MVSGVGVRNNRRNGAKAGVHARGVDRNVKDLVLPRAGFAGRLGGSAILTFFGKLSYGLYVFHYALRPACDWLFPASELSAVLGSRLLGVMAHINVLEKEPLNGIENWLGMAARALNWALAALGYVVYLWMPGPVEVEAKATEPIEEETSEGVAALTATPQPG